MSTGSGVLPPGWFRMACPYHCGWWREFPSLGLDPMWRVQRQHVAEVHDDPYWPSPRPADPRYRKREVSPDA